jgi:hypothetical protein
MKVEDIKTANTLLSDLNKAEIDKAYVFELIERIESGLQTGKAYISASLLDKVTLPSKDLLRLLKTILKKHDSKIIEINEEISKL